MNLPRLPLPGRLLPLLLALLPAATVMKAETAVESGNRTQTLHMGNLTEPTDLDPQIVTSSQDFNIVLALMEGLTQYDPKDLHPVPGVAETWEPSADALTWIFHLRPNARWSNGDPVTARDFAYAYQRMLSPGLGSEYAYMLYSLKNGEAYNAGTLTDFSTVGVKAVDDLTLALTLAHPVPYLPLLVSHQSWYPVHKATIEKFGRMDQRGTLWTRPGNYVGNGPFVLADWKPNQVIRVTKSPSYWDRDKIRLNEVDFYPIESEATEEAAFRSGQLHLTSTIPIDKIAVYKARNPELLHQETLLATYFYRFNVTKPPLNDVRVRRALAMTINRRQLVDRVTKGGQEPAFNLSPPDIAGYTARARLKEDIPEAKRLLAEAGYPAGRGFPRLELLYNTNAGHRAIAEAIQQMWKTNLGIDVTLVNQEAKVQSDTMREMNYQIGRYAWSGDYLDPSTFLELLTSTSGNNQTGWKNAEYDRLVGEAARTADNAKRYELFQQAEQILVNEAPIAPIYFYKRDNLQLPVVKGWYGNLLDLHPFKGVYLEP
jgi:oligopeptide transport system substrate-binding protein